MQVVNGATDDAANSFCCMLVAFVIGFYSFLSRVVAFCGINKPRGLINPTFVFGDHPGDKGGGIYFSADETCRGAWLKSGRLASGFEEFCRGHFFAR